LVVAGNGNYNPKNGSVAITISKANATINVSGYSVTYNGFPIPRRDPRTGVLAETLAGLDLSGTTHTNAGSYSDTWAFTDVTGNYNNASGSVSDSIAKADANVVVNGYNGCVRRIRTRCDRYSNRELLAKISAVCCPSALRSPTFLAARRTGRSRATATTTRRADRLQSPSARRMRRSASRVIA
jgi:hypothetical protein